jgi:hypothetical protein
MSIYFIYEQPEFSPKSFLTNIDSVKEFKIGESKNPVARCKNLQTGNKRRLVIYKTVFCGTKPAAQALEATIHERYTHKRISGEWYTITKNEIDALCDEIDRLHKAELQVAHNHYFTEITA